MKVKIILTVLLVAALGLPMAYAQTSDEWFIENAITEVKLEHPKFKNTEFTAIITSGWETHPDVPLHKHVTLTGNFGFQDSGSVKWSGRSYWDGGIHTTYYRNHNPDSATLSTKILYLGPAQYWSGSRWIDNSPQVIRNSLDADCTVLILGTNGLNRTIELGKNISLMVYPPIGVGITLSILP